MLQLPIPWCHNSSQNILYQIPTLALEWCPDRSSVLLSLALYKLVSTLLNHFFKTVFHRLVDGGEEDLYHPFYALLVLVQFYFLSVGKSEVDTNNPFIRG